MTIYASVRQNKAQNLQNLWQGKKYHSFPVVILNYVNRDTPISVTLIFKSELANILNKAIWLPSITTANFRAKMFHVERGINQNHTKETKAPCSRYFLQWGLA